MRRAKAGLLLILLAACDRKDSPAAATGSVAAAPPAASSAPTRLAADRLLLDRPRSQEELPTTDGSLFLTNLDGQVEAATKRWLKLQPRASAALMAARLLASSAKIHGKLERLTEALAIVDRALKHAPDDAALWSTHADVCAALHRFPTAEESAKRAHALAPSPDTRAALADAAWVRGDETTAIREIRALAAEHPSFGTVVRLAQLELDLGNIQAAERQFARAETLVRDVSPVPVAWLNVQRGLMGLDTGQFERAERFYREAVARLPKYPMAVEHLAEIEGLLGKRSEALARYEAVVEQTNDPELIGALAGLLESSDAKRAKQLKQRAASRYDELLERYPEAMYWHAAGFFTEEGDDPKKAVRLLEKNLKLRPNAGSYAALASALLAVGKPEAAAENMDVALKSQVRRADLFWTAARVRHARGQIADAEALAKLARSLNPKIEILEGPLK